MSVGTLFISHLPSQLAWYEDIRFHIGSLHAICSDTWCYEVRIQKTNGPLEREQTGTKFGIDGLSKVMLKFRKNKTLMRKLHVYGT